MAESAIIYMYQVGTITTQKTGNAMLLSNKKSQSATEHLKNSIGMEKDSETGKIYLTFRTCESRKGLGEQKFEMSEIDSILAMLEDVCKEDTVITDNGLEMSQMEYIKSSIRLNDDGLIAIKTEPQQGKRPSTFKDKADMLGFVTTIKDNLQELKDHAKTL